MPDIPLQNHKNPVNQVSSKLEEVRVVEEVHSQTTTPDPHSFNNFQGKNLLDELLEGKPDAYKAKLEGLVRTTGVTVDDPIFLILVASGRLELLLDEAPQTFGHILDCWTLELETWRDKLKVSMELAQRTSVLEQQAAIASAVASSLNTAKTETTKQYLNAVPWASVTAGACVLGGIAIGFLSGMTVPPYLQGGIDPSSPVKLTRVQANALAWAMSPEGKQAKNILDWNKDYINSGQCLNDAKNLKIKMSYNNRPVKDGFCTLWVKPPQERSASN
ncbi:DUF6753 family protein [Okeania sp. SIO2B3]|uniref:DUF6753 family protein n=1 Tax=Okeania sp. SIO2B3 TaxID=2607784 RepID=UPI0013C0F992|nr:DUF6753 family protein [Okeania sp. SIO2B3]NET45868.1 hypothetical protein [Okeania sp. SIO2B3]